jgi:hypothetical protein
MERLSSSTDVQNDTNTEITIKFIAETRTLIPGKGGSSHVESTRMVRCWDDYINRRPS